MTPYLLRQPVYNYNKLNSLTQPLSFASESPITILASNAGSRAPKFVVSRSGRQTTYPVGNRKPKMSVTMSEEQLQRILKTIGSGKKGTMATCNASFNGKKDRETVEAFLTALQSFKDVENISDQDAIAGLPLVLYEEAAVWWQGTKKSITTWKGFEDGIRSQFAPKKPEHLPSIRFAMNTAPCKTTSFTPAYLTFGRELRTLDDNYHDYRQIVLSENFIPEITPKLLQLATVLERAKEVHEMEEERRKELADLRRQTRPDYSEGDKVLVTLHPLSQASKGISAKFAPRRDGPYQIKKIHGPASYEIADPARPNVSLGLYHASALTPYKSNTQEMPLPAQPLKKRGRPRKVVPQPDCPVATRKRGRPRKN